jgi:hypothetical protein
MKLCCAFYLHMARLVICTSRTVGSAKKFVRITSGFGGGEFTKTLRKVCTCQKLKLDFLMLEYCKIRECYALYRQSISKWFYAKSQCQSPFPLSLESCHLLKVDRE